MTKRAQEDDPGPVPEALRRELEELGLSPYEARVVLTLMRLGSANSLQLARVSEVPRTSTYQVLEELGLKGLAVRIPGEGPAVWASPGREEVLDRLEAREEEHLREHRARTARMRESLAEAFPETPSVALPYVHVIHGAAQAKAGYEALLAKTQNEILMFTRPPYSWAPGDINASVMGALSRNVETRVIYEAAQVEDAGQEVFRREIEAYHQAGVQGRVVDELPLKLVIADRKAVLMAMTGPVSLNAGFPANLLVEHEGFAGLQADAFERRWQSARPYGPGGPSAIDLRGTEARETSQKSAG